MFSTQRRRRKAMTPIVAATPTTAKAPPAIFEKLAKYPDDPSPSPAVDDPASEKGFRGCALDDLVEHALSLPSPSWSSSGARPALSFLPLHRTDCVALIHARSPPARSLSVYSKRLTVLTPQLTVRQCPHKVARMSTAAGAAPLTCRGSSPSAVRVIRVAEGWPGGRRFRLVAPSREEQSRHEDSWHFWCPK